MGGTCEGSKNQKNSGPKESEPPKMEDDYEEGIIKGAKEMKLLEETDQKEKGKCNIYIGSFLYAFSEFLNKFSSISK